MPTTRCSSKCRCWLTATGRIHNTIVLQVLFVHFPTLPSRSAKVCLASTHLLQMHVAPRRAGKRRKGKAHFTQMLLNYRFRYAHCAGVKVIACVFLVAQQRKDDDASECKTHWTAYHSICPGEWVSQSSTASAVALRSQICWTHAVHDHRLPQTLVLTSNFVSHLKVSS